MYKDVIELIYDYVNKKINYEEYLKQLCILNIGEDNYDKYELYEYLHKLYVYTKDNNMEAKEYQFDTPFSQNMFVQEPISGKDTEYYNAIGEFIFGTNNIDSVEANKEN